MGRLIPGAGDPAYPFLFRLARTFHTLLQGHRGQYFLYSLLARFSLLDRAGRFDYFGGHIYIPLKVPETLFVDDFSLYQGLRELQFAFDLNTRFEEFLLLDCGAYFGQVSMRLCKLCPGLRRVVLVDPNEENCRYVEANISQTGIPFEIVNAAVSDYSGQAELRFPDGPNVPDSAFIERSDSGDIRVTSIDDLCAGLGIDYAHTNIALKLDVEGEEIAAVTGAAALLREAAGVCVFMELHPGVLARKGQTAEGLLRAVSDLRPMRWYLADRPQQDISPDAPVFPQVGGERICDVIGVSLPR